MSAPKRTDCDSAPLRKAGVEVITFVGAEQADTKVPPTNSVVQPAKSNSTTVKELYMAAGNASAGSGVCSANLN
ncbi:hypothetical protein ACN24K_31185 [Streptomyces microflavus]